MTDFTKLSALVDDKFTVEETFPYIWKMWDNDNKKMLVSDEYVKGYRKIYSVKTDKGLLDLGSGQLATLLEAVFYKGAADINGKTFAVKSNGKTGMDIRYFFNVQRTKQAPLPQKTVLDTVVTAEEFDEAGKLNLSEIPF